MTLDQYRAKTAAGESEAIPKLELRKANEGTSELFKGAKQLVKDVDANNYFVGKVRVDVLHHMFLTNPTPSSNLNRMLLVHARKPNNTLRLRHASIPRLAVVADEVVVIVVTVEEATEVVIVATVEATEDVVNVVEEEVNKRRKSIWMIPTRSPRSS
jgi:hypothetical protein